MDYEEFVKMGHKARQETQDFINRHIHDREKRWPVMCRSEHIDTVQMELFPTSSHIPTSSVERSLPQTTSQ